ncbi:MAG: [FeFe] hydrogenase H-cluster radical SAM maturase HydG, partial [Spirochaetaceae bacterium]|nr:[FeFe] hydrogenase H-cluster radical SAM maturase HydG [Spirochaetaceae bacterium]
MNENFIDGAYIRRVLDEARRADGAALQAALDKAERFEGLSHHEVAALLVNDEPAVRARIFEIAGKIKR